MVNKRLGGLGAMSAAAEQAILSYGGLAGMGIAAIEAQRGMSYPGREVSQPPPPPPITVGRGYPGMSLSLAEIKAGAQFTRPESRVSTLVSGPLSIAEIVGGQKTGVARELELRNMGYTPQQAKDTMNYERINRSIYTQAEEVSGKAAQLKSKYESKIAEAEAHGAIIERDAEGNVVRIVPRADIGTAVYWGRFSNELAVLGREGEAIQQQSDYLQQRYKGQEIKGKTLESELSGWREFPPAPEFVRGLVQGQPAPMLGLADRPFGEQIVAQVPEKGEPLYKGPARTPQERALREMSSAFSTTLGQMPFFPPAAFVAMAAKGAGVLAEEKALQAMPFGATGKIPQFEFKEATPTRLEENLLGMSITPPKGPRYEFTGYKEVGRKEYAEYLGKGAEVFTETGMYFAAEPLAARLIGIKAPASIEIKPLRSPSLAVAGKTKVGGKPASTLEYIGIREAKVTLGKKQPKVYQYMVDVDATTMAKNKAVAKAAKAGTSEFWMQPQIPEQLPRGITALLEKRAGTTKIGMELTGFPPPSTYIKRSELLKNVYSPTAYGSVGKITEADISGYIRFLKKGKVPPVELESYYTQLAKPIGKAVKSRAVSFPRQQFPPAVEFPKTMESQYLREYANLIDKFRQQGKSTPLGGKAWTAMLGEERGLGVYGIEYGKKLGQVELMAFEQKVAPAVSKGEQIGLLVKTKAQTASGTKAVDTTLMVQGLQREGAAVEKMFRATTRAKAAALKPTVQVTGRAGKAGQLTGTQLFLAGEGELPGKITGIDLSKFITPLEKRALITKAVEGTYRPVYTRTGAITLQKVITKPLVETPMAGAVSKAEIKSLQKMQDLVMPKAAKLGDIYSPGKTRLGDVLGVRYRPLERALAAPATSLKSMEKTSESGKMAAFSGIKSLNKAAEREGQKLATLTAIAPAVSMAERAVSKTALSTLATVLTLPAQRTKTAMMAMFEMPKMDLFFRPPPPVRIVPFALPFEEIPMPAKGKPVQGYDVYGKEKGKWLKINADPLEKNAAWLRGATAIDNTAAASFRLKSANVKIRPAFSYPEISPKRQPLFSKFYKRGNVFIEKTKHRIDSPGELMGITLKGQQAQSAMRGMFGFFTRPKERKKKRKRR